MIRCKEINWVGSTIRYRAQCMREFDIAKNYKLKKIESKQRRCVAIVENDLQVKSCKTPTKYVAVLNAGLSTGLTAELLIQTAAEHGNISDLIMLPNKSYCFIECTTIEDAECIYKAMHSIARIGQANAVIYMAYFESLPDCPTDGWAKPNPPGLIIIPDFVDEQEERDLLEAIKFSSENDLQDNTTETKLKNRRVKHYGYEFLYGRNNIDIEKPLEKNIPSICNKLWPRLQQLITDYGIQLEWDVPDQLTVNEYEPGQGIPPHVDTHSAFLDPIVSLSLESDIVMDFRKGEERVPLILLRRSLLVMSGESRYDWLHGISPRVYDVVPTVKGNLSVDKRTRRTSLTFRRLRRAPCNCSFPRLCDTRLSSLQEQNAKSNEIDATKLEMNNVHNVYDKIATHFSDTRHSPWPKVTNFLNSFPMGSILLDIGCGNGKYLNCKDLLTIGCDRSEGLLNVCVENNHRVLRCDCLQLPLRSGTVDGCISIAVIHHLATTERRLNAIKEMVRVLRPGGRGLIYVWAKNQRANEKKSSYLLQNKAVNKHKETEDEQRLKNIMQITTNADLNVDLPIHTNRTEFQQQDVLVPWKLKNNENVEPTTYLRYYHVFEENELETMFEQLTDTAKVLKSYYDQGNHCLIFERL